MKVIVFIIIVGFRLSILQGQTEATPFFKLDINVLPHDSCVVSTYKTDPTISHNYIDIIIHKRTPFVGSLKEGIANIWRMDTSQIIIDSNSINIGYSFNYTYGFSTDLVNTITNALAYKLDFTIKDSLSSEVEKIYLVKVIDKVKMIRENAASHSIGSHIFDNFEKQGFLQFQGFPYYYFIEYLRQVDTKEGEKYPLRLETPDLPGLYDFYIPLGKTVYDSLGLNFENYNSYLDMNDWLQKMGIEIQLVERRIPLKVIKFLNTDWILKKRSRIFK